MHLKYNLPDARTVPNVTAYADQPLEPGDVIEVPDDFPHDPEAGTPFTVTDEAATRTKTEPEDSRAEAPEPGPDTAALAAEQAAAEHAAELAAAEAAAAQAAQAAAEAEQAAEAMKTGA